MWQAPALSLLCSAAAVALFLPPANWLHSPYPAALPPSLHSPSSSAPPSWPPASSSLLPTSGQAQTPFATTISASWTLIVVSCHLTGLLPFFSLPSPPSGASTVSLTGDSHSRQLSAFMDSWMPLYQALPLFLRDLLLQGLPKEVKLQELQTTLEVYYSYLETDDGQR